MYQDILKSMDQDLFMRNRTMLESMYLDNQQLRLSCHIDLLLGMNYSKPFGLPIDWLENST